MLRFFSRKTRILDSLSRQLDRIEKQYPMTNNYARVEPYIIEETQAGRSFEFIIYHQESKDWYGQGYIDASFISNKEDGFIRPGETIFDIGCNSGFTTTWYGLEASQNGRVHAFDPMPWNVAATRAQARLNRLSNVTVHQVGLGNKAETIHVHLNASRTIESGDANGKRMPLSILPLTDFARLSPTLMKIDIEGAEHEVSQCDLSLLPKVDRIFLEFHPQFIEDRGIDPRDLLRNFIRQGFQPRAHRLDVAAIEPGAEVSSIPHGIYLTR